MKTAIVIVIAGLSLPAFASNSPNGTILPPVKIYPDARPSTYYGGIYEFPAVLGTKPKPIDPSVINTDGVRDADTLIRTPDGRILLR